MRKSISNLIVISSQLLIVGLFFGTIFNKDISVEKHVSIIHNENLNKIATSVSLLFEKEEVSLDDKLEELVLEELPSISVIDENVSKLQETVEEEVVESTPLVSVDASKYIDNIAMGFEVTEGNRSYSLSDNEFNVVVAVVAGELHNEQVFKAELFIEFIRLNNQIKNHFYKCNNIDQLVDNLN